MLEGGNNLTDSNNNLPATLKGHLSLSYTKTNKLISALYMVTDTMDSSEPLRLQLRTLGTEVISDIHRSTFEAKNKIGELVSFLDIASTVGLISVMNFGILKKEFQELYTAIEEALAPKSEWSGESSIKDFLQEDDQPLLVSRIPQLRKNIGHTRLGVQRPDTLMKVLKQMSDKKVPQVAFKNAIPKVDYNVLKKERRDGILSIINSAPGGLTITDIKSRAKGELASCGEKTLQRELISMVSEGLLRKTGEKRWSKYYLAPGSNMA